MCDDCYTPTLVTISISFPNDQGYVVYSDGGGAYRVLCVYLGSSWKLLHSSVKTVIVSPGVNVLQQCTPSFFLTSEGMPVLSLHERYPRLPRTKGISPFALCEGPSIGLKRIV